MARYGTDARGPELRALSPMSLEEGWNGSLYLIAAQTGGPSRAGRFGAAKAFRYDRFAVLANTGRDSVHVKSVGELRSYIKRVIAQRTR